MYEPDLYPDPTFWAVHASLMRQQRQAKRRGRVSYSAGVLRWQKRQRIRAIVRAVMSGQYKNGRDR